VCPINLSCTHSSCTYTVVPTLFKDKFVVYPLVTQTLFKKSKINLSCAHSCTHPYRRMERVVLACVLIALGMYVVIHMDVADDDLLSHSPMSMPILSLSE
jgi:hypothetical protein